jgi:hypothetical protein
MAAAFSHLNTVEKQLKVVINLLHLMGKSVGMDVVPHTDRFSEMVLANPACFEWLQRKEYQILAQGNELYQTVESLLWSYLQSEGPACPNQTLPETHAPLFGEMSEIQRLHILFGAPTDYAGRLYRRKQMIQVLYEAGFETVPATMGPPYRGLEVDPSPDAKVTDEDGLVWMDFRITQPESFSRVFGPLTRYKLYESKNEWASRLVNILTPLIQEGFRSIFDEAVKLCVGSKEQDKYLMTFQNLLSRVPKWNPNIIKDETARIKERSTCGYLEEDRTSVV